MATLFADTSLRALAAVQAATAEPEHEHLWVENPNGGYSCSLCLADSGHLPEPEPEKNPAAVALGRLGGLKGGKARAAKLSAERRKEISEKANAARWGKNP